MTVAELIEALSELDRTKLVRLKILDDYAGQSFRGEALLVVSFPPETFITIVGNQ